MSTFNPIWEGSIEGWSVKYISKQLWRVGREHGFEDLIQDARLYFLICKDRYRVETGSHFMRLFQTCLVNHFHHLSIKRTRRNELSSPVVDMYYDEGPVDLIELFVSDDSGHTVEDSDIQMMIHDAPKPIKRLLAGLGIPDGKRQRPRRTSTGLRETTNEFFCRLAGVDPSLTDMVQRILCWVHGDSIPGLGRA